MEEEENDHSLKPEELVIEDKYYKPDLDILDRYLGYSAELLRVSLAGVAAIGFFYDKLGQFLNFEHKMFGFTVKHILIGSIIAMAISSALALAHRYISSDSMAYHLYIVRLMRAAESEKDQGRKSALQKKAKKEKIWRKRFFRTGGVLLSASAMALAVGALCLVIGFAYGLK